MERKERMIKLLKQYLLLCAGLAVMAFGVAFSVKADLGTSPISSVPCVVSMFTPFTVGTATIVMHCVFIVLQILILRRRYDPIQLLQLPVAILFGCLTDFGIWGCGWNFLYRILAAGASLYRGDPAGGLRSEHGGDSRRGHPGGRGPGSGNL